MALGTLQFQEEKPKDPAEENKEREFLKDVYIFMKKRDTPIERIPNLGFKQIDLYVMYKTVQEMGGYHQVTAQQMWKQVYNMLGGNPKSTSAATCTRRHYEKLLLPYECHKKGITVSLLPQHRPKPFPFADFSKEDPDGQRPAKRRLMSMPLQQNPMESDPRGRVFPLPLPYPPFYRQTHPVQSPHVSISSPVLTPLNPPVTQPWFGFQPSRPNPLEQVKEPLERLRSLSEQYKTSSGLSEPLNLSVKASQQPANSNPVSSFSQPSSSKNPKFLNKPSTLYAPQSPNVRHEGSEAQDNEAASEDRLYSHPSKDREAYIMDVKAIKTSSSPRYVSLSSGEDTASSVGKPSSPKTDFPILPKEEGDRYSDLRDLNLSQILPSLTGGNGGKMEIEIPLSLFHNWLKLCGSSVTMQGLKQLTTTLPSLGEQSSSSDVDVLPTNVQSQANSQHQTPVAEDLRLRKGNLPSPTVPSIQTSSPPLNTGPNPFTSYKLVPPGGILKNAVSQDVYPFDQTDFKSYTSKSPSLWSTFDKDTHMKFDSHSPLAIKQEFPTSKPYDDDVILVRKEKPQRAPQTLPMLGSGPTPIMQLTPEEVMKLKKMISSL
ncbi:AT-rich interaction domain 6 [Xyrichtys novacula]|uniref:AT-rich interaction domain 6 n=1 Tax=Xyrichtys novacula TaxID=13765 RepID=A0AAV1G8S2_XYRNO|nr:AT-rich interaction domain 6 [Xyrichtys novacula]